MDTKRTHPHLGQVVNSSCGCFCASHGFSFLEYQHSHFLLSSLWAAILAYLSFPPIPNRRTLPAALISPSSLMCTHTHGTHTHTHTHEPLCSPWSFLFLSLFLIKPRPLLHFAYLFPDMCSLKKTPLPEEFFGAVCLALHDVISCCSLSQRLRFVFEAKGCSWRGVWWLLPSLSFAGFYPSVQPTDIKADS